MKKRTILVCQECGGSFYGARDTHYCPDCAKKRKKESVIKKRLCVDCGVEFMGGPRAKRCPNCADITKRTRKQKKTIRPLGSIDKCAICGKEYVVAGGRQKYCSPECSKVGVSRWAKENRVGYYKKSGQNIKKEEKRKNQKKVCVYCLREFQKNTATSFCSDYCRTENKKILYCKYDIARGEKRNLKKYLEKREEYRRMVSDGEKNKYDIDRIV